MKNKKYLIIFIVFLIFVIFLFLFHRLRNYIYSDLDFCLDTSTCKQGIEINTEHGLIKINKESCLKYNWTWIEERDYCKLK